MAWTAPRTWSVGEVVTASMMNTHVRDNLKYLKGQAGAVALEDRLEIPTASGTTGTGLRFTSGGTGYANLQGLDLSSNSFVFFGTNRQFDGTAWQQLNSRAAGLVQITQDALTYSTFPASSSTPTERWRTDNAGNLGIGTATPQGRLHGYDTISGFMHWKYDGVDNTSRTVIPDGAGDVLYNLSGVYVVRASDGTRSGGALGSLGISVNSNIYDPGGAGTNVLQLQVQASGAVTVQRTAGSLTYKVALWLLWL